MQINIIYDIIYMEHVLEHCQLIGGSKMNKSVNKITLRIEVIKVELECEDEVKRKAEAAKLLKIATDMKAQVVSSREENNKTFLTFQAGSDAEALKVLLSY